MRALAMLERLRLRRRFLSFVIVESLIEAKIVYDVKIATVVINAKLTAQERMMNPSRMH